MSKKKDNSKIIRLKEYTELLPCVLTEAELLTFGEELGSVIQDMATEEDRQTSMKQELKARITKLESERTILATKITRKEELRDVSVEAQKDFHSNTHKVIRLDTGELVRERQLHPDEYQEEMKAV